LRDADIVTLVVVKMHCEAAERVAVTA